jgi:hypothetical protein
VQDVAGSLRGVRADIVNAGRSARVGRWVVLPVHGFEPPTGQQTDGCIAVGVPPRRQLVLGRRFDINHGAYGDS